MFLDLLEFLSSTIEDLVDTLVNTATSAQDLHTQISALTFDSANPIYSFFSTLRYVTGDVIYLTITSIIILGMTFMLVRLLKSGINFILGFIPLVSFRLP